MGILRECGLWVESGLITWGAPWVGCADNSSIGFPSHPLVCSTVLCAPGAFGGVVKLRRNCCHFIVPISFIFIIMHIISSCHTHQNTCSLGTHLHVEVMPTPARATAWKLQATCKCGFAWGAVSQWERARSKEPLHVLERLGTTN
jgi:hypothetical protein